MILGFSFDPIVPGPLLFFFALLFLAFPVYGYVVGRGNIPASLLPRLLALRALAVAVLLLAALRPFGEREEPLVEKTTLLVILDNSKSMAVRDMPEGLSRSGALEGFWKDTFDLRTAMAEEVDLSVYTFHTGLAESEGASFASDGDATAIGSALENARGRSHTGRIAGVVLFSDGCQNAGPSPLPIAEAYAGDRVRVDTVVVGSDEPTASLRDVDLRGLYAPNRVSAGMEVAVEVDLSCLAVAGQAVDLECELEGSGTTRLRVLVDRPRFVRRIALPPIRAHGRDRRRLVVRASRLEGEATYDNNVIEADIQVVKDRTMVLVVEGYLRWETKFVLRALAGAHLLEVVPIYGPSAEDAAMLSDRAVLGDFDVVVIGDVPAGRLPEAFGRHLRELAADGRGVLFLGGAAAYSAGGYGTGPFEAMLPIGLAAGDDRVEDEARALPTEEGLAHFACRLEEAPAANRAAWERLPPLVGRHRPASVKPGGSVLVAAGRDPVLVAQRYGTGRTVAFLTDSTWRWFFSEKDTAASHRRFWRQLVLWLAGRDSPEGGSVWLSLEPNRSLFDPGEAMRLAVHVVDGRGEAIDNARVEIEVVPPPEGEPLARRLVYDRDPDTGEGSYPAPYVPTVAGEYRVRATAWRGAEEIGKDERVFRVRAPAGEVDDPVARPELLVEIATATGGRCVPLSQARSILEEMRDRSKAVAITRRYFEPLWSNPWVLLLFVGILTAEWSLRKRHGMV